MGGSSFLDGNNNINTEASLNIIIFKEGRTNDIFVNVNQK